ncbi:pyridoxal phosphate-dependent decarboxylase family protein [Defluviimonas salinarum]|uniref:Pyridoxal-dependent decarboxylase n=1 Tax=Defluviimonas salinarum TaxID=2992147 RepID=A0ABT3J4L7_9RHOB|nr:pyridoxal-dependent decarboxylase [Defluviimonas salinarum]MCW3782623.1 pyridoxal-dependent decarboxylase [Defluviimonas salinarum]
MAKHHGRHGRLHASLADALSHENSRLSLDRRGDGTPETWFLGPKGENVDFLKLLVAKAIDANVEARRAYMPSDPGIFGAGPPESLADSKAFISDAVNDMLHYLQGSIPLSSFRNLSHMYWDQSLPGLVGYIAALLYNQNNVAAEASPATTLFEMEVGDDLCRMLGFELPDADATENGATRPWGHITCDGSVANCESVWASRNTKYLGVALARAIDVDPELAGARQTTVRLLSGERARLLELSPWQLLNLPLDEVLGLATRIARTSGLPASVIEAALARTSVQSLGLMEFHRRYLPDVLPPVLIAPATAHYSWAKAMALAGLGSASLVSIRVDLDGRMDTVELRKAIDHCLAERRPVMQLTAVMGSTEESAVDPLADILSFRAESREMGMEFSVHADAAWGGYFASLLRKPRHHGTEHEELQAVTETEENPHHALLLKDGKRAPGMMFNAYVMRQFLALRHVDTITTDPHKSGFVPYPAGSLCYRNGAMRDTISFKAPVVYHGGVDPAVGFYGIEGSKPGAAAAAVYLSHRVIRTDRSGYGRLLGRCIFNSKRLYAALVGLNGANFTLAPFQQLPAERDATATTHDIADQKDLIARRIVPLADADLVDALIGDPALFKLFRDIGPDLTIVTYAFNFVTAEGVNRDVALMNEMNDSIFKKLSMHSFNGGQIPTAPMFVTSSSFDPKAYGQSFVNTFARRAGADPQEGVPVSFLISTTQNPWLSEGGTGDFVGRIVKVLAATASEAADNVMTRHGLTPP